MAAVATVAHKLLHLRHERQVTLRLQICYNSNTQQQQPSSRPMQDTTTTTAQCYMLADTSHAIITPPRAMQENSDRAVVDAVKAPAAAPTVQQAVQAVQYR